MSFEERIAAEALPYIFIVNVIAMSRSHFNTMMRELYRAFAGPIIHDQLIKSFRSM